MTAITLNGHTSAETAYVVDDYPYGFRLRCKIRYWLEYKEGHGFRLCSQTTNPKKPGEVWNTPKCSTYCPITAAMFLDENNHVQWTGVSQYGSLEQAETFAALYNVEGIALDRLNRYLEAYRRYEEKKAARLAEASV